MKFQTDKVDIGLLPTYLRLAAEIGPTGRVCEIGVQNGWSLEMWQALFPYGMVVGVDNDPASTWPTGAHVIVLDQTDSLLVREVVKRSMGYDLIVDDASHEGPATSITFEMLWPLVSPGRYYVIEDWTVGFPQVRTHDSSMLVYAQQLLYQLDVDHDEVDSIEYRRGMILLKKRGSPR